MLNKIYCVLPLLLLSKIVVAQSSYNSINQELILPNVIIDNNQIYSTKLKLVDIGGEYFFKLEQLLEKKSFKDLFTSINSQTKKEVLDILGIPDVIKTYKLGINSPTLFCSEPNFEVGTEYEEWIYNFTTVTGNAIWFKPNEIGAWNVGETKIDYGCI